MDDFAVHEFLVHIDVDIESRIYQRRSCLRVALLAVRVLQVLLGLGRVKHRIFELVIGCGDGRLHRNLHVVIVDVLGVLRFFLDKIDFLKFTNFPFLIVKFILSSS